jgi:hypothetical protein
MNAETKNIEVGTRVLVTCEYMKGSKGVVIEKLNEGRLWGVAVDGHRNTVDFATGELARVTQLNLPHRQAPRAPRF